MWQTPVFRTLWRVWRGQLPLTGDLETMVENQRIYLSAKKKNVALKTRPELTHRLHPFLQTHQLRRLKDTLAYCCEHIPAYRSRFDKAQVRPEEIQSLADIRKLPLLYRAELEQRPNAFMSTALDTAPSFILRTTGTSGKKTSSYFSTREMDMYVAVEALQGMLGGWLGPEHIMYTHMSPAYSSMAKLLGPAAQKAGTLVVDVSGSTIPECLDMLFTTHSFPGKQPRASILVGSPAFLWSLLYEAERQGRDLAQSGIRRVITGGAKVTPELKQRIQAAFGITLLESYAMVENTPFSAFPCSQGALHFNELVGMAEILDPETLEPAAPGAVGVAVYTTFYPYRQVTPLLRYWSNDLVLVNPEPTCPCGFPGTRVLNVTGRVDHMLNIGADNFYPQVLGDIFLGFPELAAPPRYRAWLEETPAGQTVKIQVELAHPATDAEKADWIPRLRQALPLSQQPLIAGGIVGLSLAVLNPGEIQTPFPYKYQ